MKQESQIAEATASAIAPFLTMSGGWQDPPHFEEEFAAYSNDFLGSGSPYLSRWENLHSPCELHTPLEVSAGRVHMDHRLATSGLCAGTTDAGVSTAQQNVVPSLSTDAYKWTAVHDFWTSAAGRPDTDDDPHHPGIFVRVHFRDQQWGVPDQTRFGTIVYESVGEAFLGYLQTTGDSVSDSGHSMYHWVSFPLSSSPWPDPGQPDRWYRIQILERHVYGGQYPFYKWQTQWTTETWAGSDKYHGVFQGGLSSWITEDQVRGYGVKVPDVDDSRIFFSDADGRTGWIETDYVGTTLWLY